MNINVPIAYKIQEKPMIVITDEHLITDFNNAIVLDVEPYNDEYRNTYIQLGVKSCRVLFYTFVIIFTLRLFYR